MSNSLTGIFSKDEKCISFLDVIQILVEKTLIEAYRAAANVRDIPDPIYFTPHIAERFRFALDLIPVWPSTIIDAEERRATELCYQITDCYRSMVRLYVEEMFKDEPARAITVTIPAFPGFLHEIYKQLVQLSDIRNGIYFQLFGTHRKNVVADAIRAALRVVVSRGSSDAPPLLSPPASPLGPSISQMRTPVPAPPTPPILPPPAPSRLLQPPPSLPPRHPRTSTSKAALEPPPTRPKSTVSAAFEKAIEIDLKPELTAPPSRPPTNKMNSSK